MSLIDLVALILILGFVRSVLRQKRGSGLRGAGVRGAVDDELRSELLGLKAQMSELRDTTTRYDLSFDTALQRMDQRLSALESRSLGAPNVQQITNHPVDRA